MVHHSRTIVEGDEETYRFMVNLKKSMPTKYDWLLPVPGFWHILLHSAKALLQRYSLAGILAICRSCGAMTNTFLVARTTEGATTGWGQHTRGSGIVY